MARFDRDVVGMRWRPESTYTGSWPDESWSSYTAWGIGILAAVIMTVGAFTLPVLLLLGIFRLKAWGPIRGISMLLLWLIACAQATYLVALLAGRAPF